MNNYIREKVKPDYKIAILTVAIACFGLIMIASSSVVVAYEKFHGTNDYYYLWHQAIALLVGLLAMGFFSNFDYRNLKKIALPLMVLVLIMLIAVFIPGIGDSAKGAHRWLDLGLRFQPSEIAKVAFMIYLATWLESRKHELNKFSKALIPFTFMLGVISLLIILEPDLGTLTIIMLTSITMFFAAGAPSWHIVSLASFLAVMFIAFIRSAEYRWHRFTTFINPSSETLDKSYHVNQAFIAVSQGGFWGRGFGQSLQKMRYLPEPHTDSIFAIACEELGFVRSVFVIVGFVYLFYLGVNVAKKASDDFGKILAIGIVTSLSVQAFINIAAMLGLVPLTGVTLPFISYGGTSLVISFVQIGILLSISRGANAR